MKVTKGTFKKLGACSEGSEYGLSALVGLSYSDAIKRCIKDEKLQWANWGIVRVLSKTDRVKYAIYAAKQVLKIFEDECPGDKRPRNTIKAAEAWLKNPCCKTKDAAAAAYAAANAAAAAAAYAAAAYAAANAAAAAYAAAANAAAADAEAAYAAGEAAYAAGEAAYAAGEAASNAAEAAMRIKILKYGIGLL